MQTDYLERILDVKQLSMLVDKICEILIKNDLIVDTFLAAKGFSGVIPAAIVSYKLKMPLVFIRASEEDHSTWGIEGDISLPNYVIIDDIAWSGDTLSVTKTAIRSDREECGLEPANLKAIIFYGDGMKNNVNFWKKKFNCPIKVV